jgi:hypothetical protein
LTVYDGRGAIRVVDRARDAPVPLGAKLLGCDGQSADQVAAATLGKMWGRWQLASQRRLFGKFLFADEGSRYIRHPSVCTFEADGKRVPVRLDWKPLPVSDLFAKINAISHRGPRAFEARTLGNGIRWFSFPSFGGDPESAAGKALPPVIAAMRSDRAALAAAPAIVFDLRGNGGGSSDWSHQIAEVLWGEGAPERLPASETYVEWRVSQANLEAIKEAYARRRDSSGFSPEMRRWYETVIGGLTAALKRGDRLWRQPEEENDPARAATQAAPASPPLGATVFVLTDEACGSACLDAVELWRALGAVHVGRETSADTLYMEVRQRKLPSGITGVSMPMKVYRNRSRGSNQPIEPVHMFAGDITDTAAVEQWISSLQAKRRR